MRLGPALRAAALAASAFAAAPAVRAEDVPPVISPLRVETDHNGVNLVTGKMTFDMPELSVPAAPNLRFDRVQNAAPYLRGTTQAGDGGAGGSYSVHTGTGASESFKCSGVDCTSTSGVTGTGSTLYGKQFRQAGSGALWHFNLVHYDALVGERRELQYYATHVDYPNGERIDYSYQTHASGDFLGRLYRRPVTISSNLGYAISIAYQSDDFASAGWGQPGVVTLYAVAAPNVALARLTYDGDTITDLGGRDYVCTGCSNTLGEDLEVTAGSLRLPGEDAPALQVTAHPSAPLVASVVKDGVTWTYSYANPRLYAPSSAWRYDSVTVDGPDGFHQVYGISGLGALAAQRNIVASATDSIGRTTAFEYDPSYRPVRIVLPEQNSVDAGYDGYGNIVAKTTRPKPGQGSPIVEAAAYPTATCFTAGTPILCYRPTASLDGLGRQTDYAWNPRGQLTEQTDPADQQGVRRKTYVAYEPGTLSRRDVVRICGTGAACGSANEIRTEYDYWNATFLPSAERRIDSAQGATLTTTYDYDPAGRLVMQDGPLPGTDDASYFRYDVHGRKTWEIGPRTNDGWRMAKRFAYRDADDKLVSTESGTVPDPASTNLTVTTRTDLAYDPRRNPARETLSSASGAVYTMLDRSYDGQGRLTCEARRMNREAFPPLSLGACSPGTAGIQGPDRITRNEYDAAGQLLRVEKAFGTPIRQDYAKFEYTPNGKRKAVIDANGNRAEMSWDGFDRQKRWIFPSRNAAPPAPADPNDYEEYGYDAAGNRISLRKRDGSVLGFQYDGLNRLIAKIVPDRIDLAPAQTRDVFYDYDVRGLQLRARFDHVNGEGITNQYDALGRLSWTNTNQAGPSRTLQFAYNADGTRSRITHPDGAAFGYLHDALGRMTHHYEIRATPGIDDHIVRYWYNPAGTRYAAVRGAGTIGFTTIAYYDPVNRPGAIHNDLPGTGNDVSFTFAYNPASQIVTFGRSNDAYVWNGSLPASTAYAVNGQNQYTSVAGVTHGYDANGNLISDGSTGYLYDVENRLVSASGGKTASLVYDPLGRLFQTSGGAAGMTQFLYDGDAMVAEFTGSGTLLRRYVYGSGIDEPVGVYEGAGQGLANRRYTLSDQQGSITALINADGTPSVVNSYNEYGMPSAGNQGRFQYTGQAWIPELGMYHYKARVYSPSLGRFLQADPIGYEDQVNLYSYVGNDPINNSDPFGTDGWLTIKVDAVAEAGGKWGHAWIEYRRVEGDRITSVTSYGTYGMGTADEDGLNVNVERRDGRRADATRTVFVRRDQELRFFSVIMRYDRLGTRAWSDFTNCVSFATDVWRSATGEDLEPTGWDRPSALYNMIRAKNGNRNHVIVHRPKRVPVRNWSNRPTKRKSRLPPFACGIATKCYEGGGVEIID